MGDLLELGALRARRTGPAADARARVSAAVRAVGGREKLARELTGRLGRTVRASQVTAWETRVTPPSDVLLSAEEIAGASRAVHQSGGTIVAAVRRAAGSSTSPAILDTLTDATEADAILRYAVGVDVAAVRDLSRHPLATRVMTRPVTDLLAWPLTGRAPAVFEAADTPAPTMSRQDRAAFFGHCREAVERAAVEWPGPADPQPLRQVHYLMQLDDQSADWCRGVERAQRAAWRPDLGWTPRWVAARSAAVTAARQGDVGPIRAFVRDGLDGRPDCEDSDLSYWAWWVGEDDQPWTSDEAMTAGLRTDGRLLLDRLTAGLTPGDPLLDLTVHSCRALLLRRPRLMLDPTVRARLRRRVRAVLDSPGVTPSTRRKLTHLGSTR